MEKYLKSGERTVTLLEQVMALCVEVEERAALKATTVVPATPVVNTVSAFDFAIK